MLKEKKHKFKNIRDNKHKNTSFKQRKFDVAAQNNM
jgi:hypothetical protein